MKSLVLLYLAAVAVAVAALPAAPAAAQAQAKAQAQPAPSAAPAAWASFTPPEGKFTVLMPSAPKRSVTPVAEGPGSPGEAILYTSAGPEGVFLVGWADYAPGFKFDAQAELAANRDNFVKGVEGKLLASRAITLGGAPGIEFDVEKPGVWTGRARVYIVGGKPWQLIAINGGATLDAAKAERFFASFRLLPAR